MRRYVQDKIELLMLALFGLITLVLAQTREVIRQIARTAEEWRRMRRALRSARSERRSLSGRTLAAKEKKRRTAVPAQRRDVMLTVSRS